MAEQNALVLKTTTHQVYDNLHDNSDAPSFDISVPPHLYSPAHYYVLRGQYPNVKRGDIYNRETGEFTEGVCPEDLNPYLQWSEELEDLAVGPLKPLVEHLIRHPFNVLGYLKPSEYAANRIVKESAVFDQRKDHRYHHVISGSLRGASGMEQAAPEPDGEDDDSPSESAGGE